MAETEARLAKIRERLALLEPEKIELIDDSARHAGHAGAASGGGHYQLTLVSPRFVGLARLARHRLVYDALDPLMRGEIHALSLNLQTPEEAGL
ncbi:MAG: BolA family protein [Burkholderiaceae bacterium]